TWHSVQRFAPFGTLMVLGANISAARRQGLDVPAAALGTVGSIGTTLTEQSFLQGFKTANEALADPLNKGTRFVQQTVGSVVPQGVARVAASVDPYVRERGEGVRGLLVDPILARIPGASRLLPAKRDALGQPVERSSGFVNNFVMPT